MELIDIDQKKISEDDMNHFKNDHEYAYIRRSASGNIHVIVDEYCPICESLCDEHFRKVFFQNNKGDEFATQFINVEDGNVELFIDELDVYVMMYARDKMDEDKNLMLMLQKDITKRAQELVDDGCELIYSVVSVFKPTDIEIEREDEYQPNWDKIIHYFHKYDGEDIDAHFEIRKEEIEDEMSVLEIPPLESFVMKGILIQNRSVESVNPKDVFKGRNLDEQIQFMQLKYNLSRNQIKKMIDKEIEDMSGLIDDEGALILVTKGLQNGTITIPKKEDKEIKIVEPSERSNSKEKKSFTFKVGIDFHGVLDQKPHFWVNFAKQVHANGGEVHIITGVSWDKTIKQQLLSYNAGEKWWDHYFSIDDYLRNEKKLEPFIDYKGGRTYPEDEWNEAKGEYCKRKNITIHYDDSPNYGLYFQTPYFKIGDRKITSETKRLQEKVRSLIKMINKLKKNEQ